MQSFKSLLLPLMAALVLAPGAGRAQAVAPLPEPVTAPYTTTARPPGGFTTPGATPAGAGAPVFGQPESASTTVERSPNKRVLPPSTEPGLWAADGIRAVKSTADGPRGLPMPHLDGMPEGDAETLARECSVKVTEMRDAIEREPATVSLLREMERAKGRKFTGQTSCMVAMMFGRCVQLRMLEAMGNQFKSSLDPRLSRDPDPRYRTVQWNPQEIKASLYRFIGGQCVEGDTFTPIVDKIIREVERLFPLPRPLPIPPPNDPSKFKRN